MVYSRFSGCLGGLIRERGGGGMNRTLATNHNHNSNDQLSLTGVAPSYEPISSVWEGSDGDLLEAMFEFYATIPVDPILDSTFNAGRFWKGSSRQIVSMDIDPQHKPTIVGDNRQMTGVPSAKFGVVVYDPPHVGPQGRDKSRKRFDVDFGATVECGKEQDPEL